MDQKTIGEMMKRAKARGGDTLATPEYAARKRALAKDVLALIEENARLTRERDAYKKAKAENDERFMLERDEARAEVERMRALVKSSNQLCADAIDARDGALRDAATSRDQLVRRERYLSAEIERIITARDEALLKARILEDGAAGWQAENAILREIVEIAKKAARESDSSRRARLMDDLDHAITTAGLDASADSKAAPRG